MQTNLMETSIELLTIFVSSTSSRISLSECMMLLFREYLDPTRFGMWPTCIKISAPFNCNVLQNNSYAQGNIYGCKK